MYPKKIDPYGFVHNSLSILRLIQINFIQISLRILKIKNNKFLTSRVLGSEKGFHLCSQKYTTPNAFHYREFKRKKNGFLKYGKQNIK